MRIFDLSSPRNYRLSALRAVAGCLQNWCKQNNRQLASLTTGDVKRNLPEICKYPRLDSLRTKVLPGDIFTVTPESISKELREKAIQDILSGRVLVEDTAAGEATRLGLGTKYLLTPLDLAKASPVPLSVDPTTLLPISLGIRHKLQYALDLINLATQHGYNPSEVLRSQTILTILNEATFTPIIRELVKYGFLGFDPSRMLFMVQTTYPGIEIAEGGVRFSPHSPWRLWNHGDMAMTTTMDYQIFTVRFNIYGEIEKIPLTAEQFGEILKEHEVKVSYPIEDLDFLLSSLNLYNIALAIEFGQKGYNMVMEVTRQKENKEITDEEFSTAGISRDEIKSCIDKGLLEKTSEGKFRFQPGIPPDWLSPVMRKVWMDSIQAQKGGFWAYDQELGRGVMIESDHGGRIYDNTRKETLTQIEALNRNFNLFPKPYEVWQKMRENGLPFLHFEVKGDESGDDYIYLSPPQGDQNFLVPTAFIRNDPMTPIHNLKTRGNIPLTLLAMQQQDNEYGFADLARSYGVLPREDGKVAYPPLFTPILSRLAPKAEKREGPLSFDDFNFEMFLENLSSRSRDHLRAAFELCRVTGSLVRTYKIDREGNVRIKTILETMKGSGINYPTNAREEVYASDSKARLAKTRNEIFIGERHGYTVIDIPNPQSTKEGEIITLIVEIEETSPERLGELFNQKIERVLQRIADHGITGRDDEIRGFLVNMPPRDLLILRASELANIVVEKLRSGVSPV